MDGLQSAGTGDEGVRLSDHETLKNLQIANYRWTTTEIKCLREVSLLGRSISNYPPHLLKM